MYIISQGKDCYKEVSEYLRRKSHDFHDYKIIFPIKRKEIWEEMKNFDSVIIPVESIKFPIDSNLLSEIEINENFITQNDINKIATKDSIKLDGQLISDEVMMLSMKMISKSLKDALRNASIALKTGKVKIGEIVLSLGGSDTDIDTASLIIPGYKSNFVDAKVVEVICAPYN